MLLCGRGWALLCSHNDVLSSLHGTTFRWKWGENRQYDQCGRAEQRAVVIRLGKQRQFNTATCRWEAKGTTEMRKQGQTDEWNNKLPVLTLSVVLVGTLSMGEDSEKSFQHQGEGAGQQGPEGGREGSAWGSQGPLGGWDYCPHGLAEVARPQDDGLDVKLQFDTAAVDLGVSTAQRHQGCLCAKCFYVSTTVAWKKRQMNSRLFLSFWFGFTTEYFC